MKRLIRVVLFLLLVVSFQQANAQFRLIVEIVVTDQGKKVPGAEIKVYKGSTLVETVLTDSKGRADIPVGANGEYTIDIGGNKGLIKKKLAIDTRNVADENAKGDIPYPATVELFPKIDGMDLSILNKPIGKIKFDPDYGDFGADPGYTKSMQKQLADLEKDFLAKKKAEEAAAAGKKKQYDAAIKIADKAFAAEDWIKAEEQYKIAEKVNPDPLETYPSFQLAELQTKLIKIKKDNKRYDEAIAKADAAVASRDYEIAIAEYKRASGYKPKEAYPKDKLKETQSLLANAAKVEQDYLTAIERGDNALKINDTKTAKAAFEEALALKSNETYPKNKIKEIDDILAKADAKKAEYDNAIKAADEALKAKNFEVAKAEYNKAKGLNPREKYPVDQLAKVDVMIANAAKVEQDYLAAIEKGDQALKANDYTTAKTAFESASQLKPQESYPKDKIKEIADFIAKNEAAEKQYQDKIAAADKALAAKDYEGAKAVYNEAKTLKPAETYPAQKLTEIDGILAGLAKAEENYKKAIANGDKALAAKDFETAKAAYTEASGFKPNEQYPKDKLGEIDTIVLSNKQAEEDYAKAIQNGADAFANKDYDKSKEFYNEALKLKPEEQLPKDKLAEIEKTLAEAAEQEQKYTDAIAEGDRAFKAKEYEASKASYLIALSVKPAETYPQDQLGIIDTELEKLAAEKANAEKLEADYQAAITEGDAAFSKSDWPTAKTAFEKALTLKADETYPKDKISAIDKEIAEAADKEANYTAAIAEGDKAMGSTEYESAKAGYMKALSIKPEETYPQDQLGKIDEALEKLAADKANAEKLEADYQAAIKDGDAAFEKSDWETSKTAFEKALTLKSEEVYPKDKIAAIVAKINETAELEANYTAAITEGDNAMGSSDFEAAKAAYMKALSVKPEETYPQDQLGRIDTELEKLAAAKADAEKLEADYQAAITEGDAKLAEKSYDEAITAYTTASNLKTEETYPKDKIKESNAAKDALAAENAAAEEAAALQKKYDDLIAKGDAALTGEKLEEAKADFEAALAVKSNETYPQEKIDEINKTLDALAGEAKKDSEYQSAIAEGDQAFTAKEFENAKAGYMKALSIKPEDTYPQDQLGKIDEALAELSASQAADELAAKYDAAIKEGDQAFANQAYESAKGGYLKALSLKPEETYPQDQLSKIDEELSKLEAQNEAEASYQAAINNGDAAFNTQDYDVAKTAYLKALSLKPAETYPQDQLGKIDDAIANALAEGEADNNYKAALKEGDEAFEIEDYDVARNFYTKALSIKPEETYPQDQLGKIDEALAAMEAIRIANEKNEDLENQYYTLLAEGDGLVTQRKWDEAIERYNSALALKDEQLPKDKIAETQKLKEQELADEKAKLDELKRKDLENEYNTLIEKGELQIGLEQYESAKEIFREALALKDEQLPKDKIAEIDAKLAEIAAADAKNAAAAKLDAEYQAAVDDGVAKVNDNNLQGALNSFKKARELKPAEEYPEIKINEIEAQIAENAAKNAAEAEALNAKYNDLISIANEAFENKNYEEALTNYKKANDVKPNESLPKEKISEIESILDQLASEAEAIRIRKEQQIANQASYANAIANGDKFFAQKKWNDAENEYNIAKGLNSEESYPQEQLDIIADILAKQNAALLAEQNAIKKAAQREQNYKRYIKEGNEKFQSNSYTSAKSSFQKALGLKPDEAYPKAQIALLNEILEKERLAKIEENKRLDDPIVIKKGPKATIDTQTEEEIEAMYNELWAKQNSNKNATIDNQKSILDSLSAILKEREEEREAIAVKYIEDIQISMSESRGISSEVYLQNYESVKLQEDNQSDYYERLNVEAEKIRNNNAIDKKTFYEGMAAFNKLRNEQIVEGKKESFEKAVENQNSIEQKRFEKQSDKILEAYTSSEKLRTAIKEFNQEVYDDFYMKNYEQLQDDEKRYVDEYLAEEKAALDRRNENLTEANDQEISIRQFGEKNAESFKNNQLSLEEQAKNQEEKNRVLVEEASKRRKEQENKTFYTGEKKVRRDRSAADYPQGVTEEVIENQNGSTTIKRVVVENTQTDVYEKTLYKWGGIFYTKNGNNITKDIWDKESK